MLSLNKSPLVLILLLISFAANAEINNLSVRGFLSQGFIHTNGNNYLGETQSGSFDFGEAGLNILYRPFNRVYWASQFSIRNIGDHESGEEDFRIDYGLINFHLTSSNQYDANIKLGRFKYFYGLYSDIQDTPTAIPGVLPAQTMYFEYVYPNLVVDGLQLNQSFRFDGFGDIDFDLMYGKLTDEEKKSNDALQTYFQLYGPYFPGIQGEVDAYDGVVGLQLQYMSLDNSLLLSYGHIFYDGTVVVDLWNQDYKLTDENDLVIDVFSFEYVSDNWTITGEYGTNRTVLSRKFLNIQQGLTTELFQKVRSESYYLQYRYQLSSQFEPLVRYEVFHYDRSDKNGSKWAAANPAGKDYWRFSKSFVIGGTYNFSESVSLSSEFHIIDGAGLNFIAASNGAKDNAIENGFDRYWNMFLTKLTYSF